MLWFNGRSRGEKCNSSSKRKNALMSARIEEDDDGKNVLECCIESNASVNELLVFQQTVVLVTLTLNVTVQVKGLMCSWRADQHLMTHNESCFPSWRAVHFQCLVWTWIINNKCADMSQLQKDLSKNLSAPKWESKRPHKWCCIGIQTWQFNDQTQESRFTWLVKTTTNDVAFEVNVRHCCEWCCIGSQCETSQSPLKPMI